jgi:glycosyltransferase involved in cell wall biosynthesis
MSDNRNSRSGSEKKVLVLCYHPLSPVNFGGSVRNYHIIKNLTSRYKMYVVCPDCKGHDNHIDITLYDLAKRGIRNQLLDFRLLRFMFSLIKREKIRILFQKDIYCGFYTLLLHFMTRIPFYMDEHNVEFIRLKRMGNRYWWVMKVLEWILCSFSKEIFCVSDLDKSLITTYFKISERKIKVIQNGFEFDKSQYEDLDLGSMRLGNGLEAKGRAILFFGNLYYQPNVEALKVIFDEIMPRIDHKLDYKIWIIGKGELPEGIRRKHHPRVIFLGEKPDVYPYILASDLIIVPLISGGGTRIKIIEAIAAGKQVLSTSLGAEGIDRSGLDRNLVIEDEWDQFANRIIQLLLNRSDRLVVPPEFIDKFRWKNIVEEIVF